MSNSALLINVAVGETRVALVEQGIARELFVERRTERSPVGNIYLGKVTRVLPGMQAAFIDVGLDRAAFLHVEDLQPAKDADDTSDNPVPTDLNGGKGDNSCTSENQNHREILARTMRETKSCIAAKFGI